MTDLKLVIKGIPFEATVDDVVKFFGVSEDAVNLPTWSDSGRCKGVAFLELSKEEDVKRVRDKDGANFTAGENTRKISIADFEERPQKKQSRKKRTKNKINDNADVEKTKPSYEEDDESKREVYVSNLSFKATKEDIEDFFKGCGEVEAVTIPKLYTSGRPKGFAFVRFKEKGCREKAIKLNDSTFMERTIGVRENKGRAPARQNREKKEKREGLSTKPKGCTTIYVGNLPWATDETELAKLFPKQKVKNARIVRQSWTKKSRGFGYVEFEDESDVDAAVKMELKLVDRVLRLDYAEQLSKN